MTINCPSCQICRENIIEETDLVHTLSITIVNVKLADSFIIDMAIQIKHILNELDAYGQNVIVSLTPVEATTSVCLLKRHVSLICLCMFASTNFANFGLLRFA